ncbi:hypothetical protein PCANC_28756 [Puccinia coronata f. sp. avenae]|uniref:CCHC-type domain-containing protein n=1 Tax=Puccinia coronata f. sp. avenae TaxID=200324 RepID=A0A2N5RY09_9BASI|nr:hypothetical protein PCANC_28756 [Puccinia coronata f. sp. avenae]
MVSSSILLTTHSPSAKTSSDFKVNQARRELGWIAFSHSFGLHVNRQRQQSHKSSCSSPHSRHQTHHNVDSVPKNLNRTAPDSRSTGAAVELPRLEACTCPATWEDDNETVCAILVQIVDQSNLRYFWEHADDAAGMWGSLSKAHQDSSTGGRVYWIRKLVNARMPGDDIDAHIDSLAQSHERLNSLVTPDKPLTPDDVHVAALLSLIPPDWIHCVSALMNQEGVKTETIVKALKNEAVRRESQQEIISVSSTKPKPIKPANPPSKARAQEEKPRCPLCNRDGHDLNSCNNIKGVIQEHKAAQKSSLEGLPARIFDCSPILQTTNSGWSNICCTSWELC